MNFDSRAHLSIVKGRNELEAFFFRSEAGVHWTVGAETSARGGEAKAANEGFNFMGVTKILLLRFSLEGETSLRDEGSGGKERGCTGLAGDLRISAKEGRRVFRRFRLGVRMGED